MSPEDLLKGTFYALEQCGVLLRDANILYRNGSYASTIVLAAFGREELGRYRILLDLWRRSRDRKETFSADQIGKACDDHVTKQQAGMLSVNVRADRDSGLGKILRAKMENHPHSEEYQSAEVELNRINEIKIKRTPHERHGKRMSALYVEPESETQWNRPADESSPLAAHDFLQDAVNDYSVQYHQDYINSQDSILKDLDPELEELPQFLVA